MYNRFGNTVNYMVANYPGSIANMPMSQQRALAKNQARIDNPCCGPLVQATKVNFPLPFVNKNRPCCK